MGHVKGESRFQMRIMCLDEQVPKDSVARFIDRFIGTMDMEALGFTNAVTKRLGRHPYDPACLAKLLVYGYERKVRSSRKLESLTHDSIEAMWLMEMLKPDFKTISDFRKDNLGPLEALFAEYNEFAIFGGLFGKERVAIDGTKIQASNNKKNNYSKDKLEKGIEYSGQRIKEYLALLEGSDEEEDAREAYEAAAGGNAEEEEIAEEGMAAAEGIEEEKAEEEAAEKTEEEKAAAGKIEAKTNAKEMIKEHEKRIETKKAWLDIINAAGANEISTVDPDARLMGNNRSGVDVAYNVQAAVDGKAHLVAAFDISQNPTDHGQLANMTEKAQAALGENGLTVLADKGYYGGEEIEKAEKLGPGLLVVARQLKPGEKDGSKYSLDKFVYDNERDEYICPEGNVLPAHSEATTKDRQFFDKAACAACPARGECLNKENQKFRRIVRKSHNDALDRADKRYAENLEEYKYRQQIVEHVFGTVKRTMDGGYFLLRTIEKVRAETALLFLGYNIKRTIGCLGFEKAMELLDWYREIRLRDGGFFVFYFLKPVFAFQPAAKIFAARLA
ncbi:MAG: IS1182 family transposase [Clostridiales bacterium]|nr:IS1182 family transposase [Clostridiales bacterium]